MNEPDELRLHPVWRQAVKEFLAANIQPGCILPNQWLEAHFGMQPLESDSSLTSAQFRDRQFTWLRNLDAFRRELLEQHQICLISEHGQGYLIVPPGEQTAAAMKRFLRELKRSYRTVAVRTKNVKLDELTSDQRKENVDAIAKLSMLQGMHRKALN